MNGQRVIHVCFLCTGNSARSILAEAILNRQGGGRFKAFSAGSQPTGKVHPDALELLRAHGYDSVSARSKSWHEFAAPDVPPMDLVFTVCDNAAHEVCPVWPGQPITAHWGIPDPAAVTGSDADRHAAFCAAYRMLSERIAQLVSLPLESLDPLTLKGKLDEIGRRPSSAPDRPG